MVLYITKKLEPWLVLIEVPALFVVDLFIRNIVK